LKFAGNVLNIFVRYFPMKSYKSV